MTKMTKKEIRILTDLAKKADAQQLAESSMPEWAREVAIDVRIPMSVKVEHDHLAVESWESKSGKEMHRVTFLDGSTLEFCGSLDKQLVAWNRGGVAEAPEPEQKPTWVHLADDQVCFRADRTEADDWSGNALPLFTRYEAERIAEHMNDANWCDERHEFDAEVDEYRVWDGDELLEVFAGTDVDGLHVYPIGTGIWTWEIDA